MFIPLGGYGNRLGFFTTDGMTATQQVMVDVEGVMEEATKSGMQNEASLNANVHEHTYGYIWYKVVPRS
jgi:hypothetical protein